jgi:hypothetical protein
MFGVENPDKQSPADGVLPKKSLQRELASLSPKRRRVKTDRLVYTDPQQSRKQMSKASAKERTPLSAERRRNEQSPLISSKNNGKQKNARKRGKAKESSSDDPEQNGGYTPNAKKRRRKDESPHGRMLSQSVLEKHATPRQQDTSSSSSSESDSSVESEYDVDRGPQPGDFDYDTQFHDDGTGQKPMHSYALNFSIQLMNNEAGKATATAVAKAKKKKSSPNGKNAANLRLVLDRHSRKIIDRVRQRLRSTKLPASYLRVATHKNMENIKVINEQKREEIAQSTELLRKLAQQREMLGTQLRNEQNRKHGLQARWNSMQQADRERIHPLLSYARQQEMMPQKQRPELPLRPSRRLSTFRYFTPAPPGTMARLCEAMVRNHEESRPAKSEEAGKKPPPASAKNDD